MTHKEHAEIYKLYKKGKTLAEIAQIYDIHLTTVHFAVKKHLEHTKNLKDPLYKAIQDLDIKESAKNKLFNILKRNKINTIADLTNIDITNKRQMNQYSGIGDMYCKYILFLQNHIKK